MSSSVDSNNLKGGMKVEIEGEVYEVISNNFVRPGKGQPFAKVVVKNMVTGKSFERTFKSGKMIQLADVEESTMRMLYKSGEGVVFMNEKTFEEICVPFAAVKDVEQWLMEDLEYELIVYKGDVISVAPPIFINMKVVDTDPALRGDTSGRVEKAAIMENGAKIHIPIFIDRDEIVKVDTRTGKYVSRAEK